MSIIKRVGVLRRISLWFEYNDTYINIQKNPRAHAALRKDRGVKFMRRGWWIVFLILWALSIYGNMRG